MAQPLAAPFCYFTDNNGLPLVGGKVYTYTAGTATPQASYTDSTGGTPNANPVILDSAGRASIWLSGAYKIVVQDSLGNTIHTDDNITTVNSITSLTDTSFTFVNGSDSSKKLAFDLSQITTGTTRTIAVPDKNGTLAMLSDITSSVIPQGRLTLSSGTPVMTTDTTAAASVYYTPYIGNNIPIYSGTAFAASAFAQLTMTLNATNNTSGNLYDLFVFLNTGTVTIASGPAWTNSSTRSAAITQVNGIWVNNAIITLTNGATSYASIAANKATYVGTVYCTANAQTGMQFRPSAASGGSNAILGLYNAYNQVLTASSSLDSATSYTYAVATWRSANASNSNRISYVDGLAQAWVDATYQIGVEASSNVSPPYTGINLNSTSATPRVVGGGSGNFVNAPPVISPVSENFTPTMGFNYIQAMEFATGGTSSTFLPVANSQQVQRLGIKLAM